MDYREVKRFMDDPVRVRSLAKVLLTLPGLSDRQIDFLSDMAEIKGRITTRQGEALIGIRDDMQEVATYRDFNVSRLLCQCWEARLDLDEADEEFIVKHRGRSTIKRRNAGRLLRCAKKLELID